MNKLLIPPSINWFDRNAAACAPDNTIVYASRSDIIVIEPRPIDEPAEIKILPRKHAERILCVAVNPGWDSTQRLILSAADDKSVRLWNLDDVTVDLCHGGHTTRSDKLIGAVFAGSDRVVSVSEEGYIIIWRYKVKQLDGLNNLFGNKVKVACVSSSPHATWLVAFGLKQGTIVVADLRGSGKVMYRLTGHENKTVCSLSWCPAPLNVFPKNSKMKTLPKQVEDITAKENGSVSESNMLTGSDVREAICYTQNIVEVDKPYKPLDEKNVTEDVHSKDMYINTSSLQDTNDESAANLEDMKKSSENLIICDAGQNQIMETSDTRDVANKEKGEGSEEYLVNKTSPVSAINADVQNNELISSISSISINVVEVNDIRSDTTPSIKKDCVGSSNNSSIFIEKIIVDTQNDENIKTDVLGDQCVIIENLHPDIHSTESASVVQSNLSAEIHADEKKSLDLKMNSTEKSVLDNMDLRANLNNVQQEIHLDTEISTLLTNTLTKEELTEDVGSSETDPLLSDVNDEPVKEYLLASTVQGGRSIIIWRAGTDGQKQVELQLHNKHKSFRNKRDDTNTWISLCWIKPTSLLSSSLQGELIEWDLSSFTSNKTALKWNLIHNDHYGYIFSIVAPFRHYESVDSGNWREKNVLNAWTFGKDRVILNTCLSSERNVLALYPTFAGGVVSITSSPLSPNRLAIAFGEGCCRLWDIRAPHCQYISMLSLSERSKISCTAWHPCNDVMLAFGTTDGKVGLMDSCNLSKKPSYLVHHMFTNIYQLEWAPLNGNSKNMGLYVLTNGKIFIYDTNKPLQEPFETHISDDDFIYSFTWKPDYSICAIGTKAGTVILASAELRCVQTLYLESRTIRFLAWHPQATVDNPSSSCHNWLALCSIELKIYDCSINVSNGAPMEENSYYKNIIATFNEHSSAIHWLAWNPHQEGIIASASEDGSVLVWDVKLKTLMHCCRQSNLEAFTCVMWSPYNADLIITGSKDSVLVIWKLSENLPKEKIGKRIRKKLLIPGMPSNSNAHILSEQMEIPPKALTNGNLTTIQEPKRLNKFILPSLAHTQNSIENNYYNCQKIFDFIFKQSVNGAETIDEETDIKVTQIFGSKDDISSLLEFEKQHDSKTKYPNSNEHISLWQGNIGGCIKNAISEETLNPWLVNLAPMVSPCLWQEACVAYAEQLSRCAQKDPFLIASYYLACHRVQEAIEALCVSSMFREALALAKLRLLEGDPLINSVIEQWAEYASTNGQSQIACQCYIVLNRLEDAAKVLFKGSDTLGLKLAAELAKKTENTDLLEAILYKLSTIKTSDAGDNSQILKPLPTRAELELQLSGISDDTAHGEPSENCIDMDDSKINSKSNTEVKVLHNNDNTLHSDTTVLLN